MSEGREGELSALMSELSVWQGFENSAGWRKLKAIAEGQMAERLKVFRAPLERMDMAFLQEYQKGEIAGIELFSQIPEIEIDRLKTEIETLEGEIENESEGDKGSGSGERNLTGRSPGEPIDPEHDSFGDDSPDDALGAP